MTPIPAWHLLIHQLPARPLYLRARVRRLLSECGAVPLKNAVYALPRSAAALDRFTSIAEEIRNGGGEAFVCEASFTSAIEKLERSFRSDSAGRAARHPESLIGRVWVTRRGIHVDRLACAWLVRRFIDPRARFRFADPNDLRAGRAEITFDVPGGRFSHEHGRCSAESLVIGAGIDDPGARRIAEIVHDLDIKDDRFGHPETTGVAQLVTGIVQGHDDDRERLERGLALFDDLHRSYRKPARVTLDPQRIPKPPRGFKKR